MEREIVIVGAGVAGLTLANRLAEKDIPSTVVGIPPPPAEDVTRRTSTPIIPTRVAELLDFPVLPEQLIDSMHPGMKTNLARKALSLVASAALRRRNFVALDTEVVRRNLWETAQASPLIELVAEKAVDVEVEERCVTSVLAESGEIFTAPLIVDATGRPARVASKVTTLIPDSIHEQGFPQPSGILGGYISFRDTPHTSLPDQGLIIGRIPTNGVIGILAKHTTPESPATHLLLFEGETHLTQEAMRFAQQEPGSPTQKHLKALHTLTQGTSWQQIVEGIATIDRLVYFQHQRTLFRSVRAKGLSLLGDAQGVVNPIQGAGYLHITTDAARLAYLLTHHPVHAGEIYNITQVPVFSRRLERAQKRLDRFTRVQRMLARR